MLQIVCFHLQLPHIDDFIVVVFAIFGFGHFFVRYILLLSVIQIMTVRMPNPHLTQFERINPNQLMHYKVLNYR